MIVRNEAHIVHEVLDSAAPHISSWVVVDTGSSDGTQDVIRKHMAQLGIPGEVHDRPWRNFGHNRTEALELAQGHGDYIWVMDADDLVVGNLDLTGLTADAYEMQFSDEGGFAYWRTQLMRNGLPWRYRGVVHEYADCDVPYRSHRLHGDYYIDSRRLGGRNLDPQKYQRDCALLHEEIERNPNDGRSVFYLGQSYYCLDDFANSLKWYARRAEMGDWDEEVYFSLVRVAESKFGLGAPWSELIADFLRAWEFRPTRAEAVYTLAFHLRHAENYQLAYLFAKMASEIPLPVEDKLFVRAAVYSWHANDEVAVCASWIGKPVEAFTYWRRALASTEVPEEDRRRIAINRDLVVPAMIELAQRTPDLARLRSDGDVTVTIVAGPDRGAVERTVKTFLNCCSDTERIGRFLVIDTGLSHDDRTHLGQRYPFLEFRPFYEHSRDHIETRFWLHLGQGWQFFAPENLITRLTAVLDAEPDVFQVGINYADATHLTGTCAPNTVVRHTPETGRYTLTDKASHGPAMFDITRLDRLGKGTATLDEVLCTVLN